MTELISFALERKGIPFVHVQEMTEPEPHQIVLPGEEQFCECSECGQLFLPRPFQTSARFTDEFIAHVRKRHDPEQEFPLGVSVVVKLK